MLIGIIYFFVILVVISTGAIAGISGGVILRPVFDLIGYHDPLSIAFYMGVAVLTMAVSSTIKQIVMGTKINFSKVFALAAGSFTGGVIGQFIMDVILANVGGDVLQIIQGVLSIASLIFVLAFTRENVKKYDFKGTLWYVLTGLALGTFATVLAIGGGPINVIVFVVLFGITLKEATVYSITTIFFAQAARLSSMGVEHGFSTFDLSTLFFVIPAAIIGGVIGGRLNVLLPEASVMKVFKLVVSGTILLNIYNVTMMIL
ncbi:MAG: sulfite exporter TauE/SafE family protein [Turicibacter sp.]|nr:sulfite exporter TauE/SafE family protein [Turicibacter sp.]